MRLTIPGNRKVYIAVIGAITLGISFVHYWTSPKAWPLQSIYMDLYYIPVLLGGLAFGLRGAMITYACVAALYLPYILITWHVRGLFLAEDLLHALFFGVFAFLTAVSGRPGEEIPKAIRKGCSPCGVGASCGPVAHELRSPLTVIAGFAQHAQKKKEHTEKAIGIIIDAALRCKEL